MLLAWSKSMAWEFIGSRGQFSASVSLNVLRLPSKCVHLHLEIGGALTLDPRHFLSRKQQIRV